MVQLVERLILTQEIQDLNIVIGNFIEKTEIKEERVQELTIFGLWPKANCCCSCLKRNKSDSLF